MRNPKKQTFSTLTGEFSSPVTEMLYRRASWQQTKLQLRIIYGICLVGYLAVIIPDYLGLGFSTEWLALTATRLVVSTTFIAVLLETMRRKPGKSLPWVIFTAQVIFAIGEIIQVELSVKAGMMDNVPDLPFVLIAIFIYFAFTENRLLLTLVASLFAGMGGILHMATLMPDPATYALRYSIICLGIILFTYLFMRMLYRIRRAQWIDSRNLAIENQVRLRQEQKLREADRKKDLFLQILNHEMRTPLYGMLGMLESATADDRQDQDAKVETALNSGKVLMQLINDVLDISGDSPDILLREEQDSFSLRQLLATTRQVMENYHHAQPGQLHLHIDPALPDLVHADQTRIQQILYNLLSNAFKYGGGKAIGLAVKPERQSGQVMWISFAVEDNGPGIPQKMQGHIFDAFSRNPDGNDSGIEGLGLGLYIARQVATLIDGKLDYQPAPTGGSIFGLEVPVSLDAELAPVNAALSQRIADLPGRHVMVVDDAAIARSASTALLERLGQDVITADSGHDALTQYQQGKPDLVFMDLSLGDMTGFDAARNLRDAGYDGDIIALTAYSTDNLPSPSKDGLFRHFFDKPLAMDLLLDYLEQSSRHLLPVHNSDTDNGDNDLPVLDMAFIRGEIDLLGLEYWRETVTSFAQHAAACLKDMQASAAGDQTRDQAFLRKKCHYLAGLAANTGLPRLKTACRNYEAKISAMNSDATDKAIDHLSQELDLALAEHAKTLEPA